MKVLVFSSFDIKLPPKFKIQHTFDTEEFEYKILNYLYDVIIVDFDYISIIINNKKYIKSKIIFLCNYVEEFIYKKALQFGDECFSINEQYKLAIRIEYLSNYISSSFKYKNLIYNFHTKTLYKDKEIIKLTKSQQELLEFLIQNKNNITPTDNILQYLEHINSKQSLKVIIHRLRKIGFDIKSYKKLGYKLIIN